MKIISNGVCYIQKIDFNFISDFCPKSVFNELSDSDGVLDINEKDDFLKFTNNENMKYLENLDYILDYNVISNLDESILINEIKNKLNTLATLWLKSSKDGRISLDRNHEYNFKIKLLKYQLDNLEDYATNKQKYQDEVLKIKKTYTKIKK